MRLVYLWQSEHPWDIRIRKITESLAQAGHHISVVARKVHTAEIDEETLAHGVRVFRVGGRFSQAISGSPVWSRALDTVIRRVEADALIVRDLPLIVNAVRAAARHRLPLVMDMAEHYPGALRVWRKYQENPVARLLVHRLRLPDRLERWGVGKVDLVWVVCQEQVERLRRDYGVPPEKLVEVGNTPALDWFANSRKGCSNPPRVLGHHGHMTPERGLDLLIEAFTRVCGDYPALTLELAGGGEVTASIQALIRSLGVDGRVKMLGRYQHSELDRLYGQTDVAVLPYPPGELIDHTLSNKIFDYMACGKPVITSGSGPMKRLMRETGAGLSFEPWTAPALEQKLRLLLDGGDLAAMSANGTKAFRTRYHWEQDAARMLKSLTALQPVAARS
jgi:glycosyltransferase involved in cell wall biosynthesis